MKRQPSSSLCISACGPNELPETVHERLEQPFVSGPVWGLKVQHECWAQKDPLRAAAARYTVWKAMLLCSCHIGQNIQGKLFKHKNTISCLSEYAWVNFLFMILDKRGYKWHLLDQYYLLRKIISLSFFYLSIYSRNTSKIHLRWLAIRAQNKMSCIIRDNTIENEGSKSSKSSLTEKKTIKSDAIKSITSIFGYF